MDGSMGKKGWGEATKVSLYETHTHTQGGETKVLSLLRWCAFIMTKKGLPGCMANTKKMDGSMFCLAKRAHIYCKRNPYL